MSAGDGARPEPPEEFRFIARHFRKLAGPGGLDLLDDAALLSPPPGQELVLTADAMVEGVHFLPEDPAELVGRKLLRVNLSDLAAKGAAPLHYLLTVSARPGTPDAWFAGFASGLARDQEEFGITLLGGDTTSTPGPLSLSLTCIGHVPPGAMLRRAGARPGDGVWVTGTIGDGALGLRAIRGEVDDPDGWLACRYRLPRPRVGLVTPAVAAACMDVSDGLVQDLGHLCRASGVGAEIRADLVPLSDAARAAGATWLPTCLSGGDDYELLIGARPEQERALQEAAGRLGIQVARIGVFTSGEGVRVLDASGAPIALERGGWSHF